MWLDARRFSEKLQSKKSNALRHVAIVAHLLVPPCCWNVNCTCSTQCSVVSRSIFIIIASLTKLRSTWLVPCGASPVRVTTRFLPFVVRLKTSLVQSVTTNEEISCERSWRPFCTTFYAIILIWITFRLLAVDFCFSLAVIFFWKQHRACTILLLLCCWFWEMSVKPILLWKDSACFTVNAAARRQEKFFSSNLSILVVRDACAKDLGEIKSVLYLLFPLLEIMDTDVYSHTESTVFFAHLLLQFQVHSFVWQAHTDQDMTLHPIFALPWVLTLYSHTLEHVFEEKPSSVEFFNIIFFFVFAAEHHCTSIGLFYCVASLDAAVLRRSGDCRCASLTRLTPLNTSWFVIWNPICCCCPATFPVC